jgi:hypothetical protein
VLTSARDGGEWSPSRPNFFTPLERAYGTYLIGGGVGPSASLNRVAKKSHLLRESNPGRPVPRSVIILTEILRLPQTYFRITKCLLICQKFVHSSFIWWHHELGQLFWQNCSCYSGASLRRAVILCFIHYSRKYWTFSALGYFVTTLLC